MVRNETVTTSYRTEYRTVGGDGRVSNGYGAENGSSSRDANDPYWDRTLNRLLDDLQADLGSPSNREVERVITQSSSSSRVSRARSPPGLGRSDGMALELSSPQLVRRSSTGRGVSPSPGGLGVVRSREEFTTPDKKTRVVTEKYSKEDRPDPNTRTFESGYTYSSKSVVPTRITTYDGPSVSPPERRSIENDRRFEFDTARSSTQRTAYNSTPRPVSPARRSASLNRSNYRYQDEEIVRPPPATNYDTGASPFRLGTTSPRSTLKRTLSLDRSKPSHWYRADGEWVKDGGIEERYTSSSRRYYDSMHSERRGHSLDRSDSNKNLSLPPDRTSKFDEYIYSNSPRAAKKDAHPIQPGYGSDWVEGQDIVRRYNYEYMDRDKYARDPDTPAREDKDGSKRNKDTPGRLIIPSTFTAPPAKEPSPPPPPPPKMIVGPVITPPRQVVPPPFFHHSEPRLRPGRTPQSRSHSSEGVTRPWEEEPRRRHPIDDIGRGIRTVETRSLKSRVDEFDAAPKATSSPVTEDETRPIIDHRPVREPTPPIDRKFPTNLTQTPTGSQRPPRDVEDLMRSVTNTREYQSTPRPVNQTNLSANPPPKTVKLEDIDRAVVPVSEPNNNVDPRDGKPVYYPPGYKETVMSTLERRKQAKDAPMWQSLEREKGWYKAKGKAKGKYKASEKESKGAVAVPVCLPLCCAAPLCCTLM